MKDMLTQDVMEEVLEVISEYFGNCNPVPKQKEGNDAVDDNDVIEPSVQKIVEWLGGRPRVPSPAAG